MSSALKYILLIVLAFFSFFYGAVNTPLFDTSEGVFARSAVIMAEGGDFLTPIFDDKPNFDNPPLMNILQAGAVKLIGVNETAFRLPSVLSACLWVFLIYVFVRANRGEEMAYNAAFIACSSVIFSIFAKLAVADVMLNMFLAGSMFAIYAYFVSGKIRYVYVAFAAAGFGAITKGPVAAFVPFIVSILFFLSAGRMREWGRAVFSPVGLILMLGIALPWYVIEYMRYGTEFVQGFLIKNNFSRFSGLTLGEGGGFGYYIPVLMTGLLPATSLLFSVLKRLRPLWNDSFSRFMLIWFFSVFIFFALSGTKLPHLILSGMTPLFILCAYVFNNHRKKLLLGIPVLIFFLFLLTLPFVIPTLAAKVGSVSSAEMLLEAASMMDMRFLAPIGSMFAILVVLIFITTVSYRSYAAALALCTLIALNVIFLPLVADVKQAPVKEAALYAKEKGMKVSVWAPNVPSFEVYYGARAGKDLPAEGGLVFIYSDKASKTDRPYITVKQWAGYRLIFAAEDFPNLD